MPLPEKDRKQLRVEFNVSHLENSPPRTLLLRPFFSFCTLLIMFFALSLVLAVPFASTIHRGIRRTSVVAAQAAENVSIPDYFQITPALFQGMKFPRYSVSSLTRVGPTATGSAPFLAETNPSPFNLGRTFTANNPLEVYEPISGEPANASIFQLMGNLRQVKDL